MWLQIMHTIVECHKLYNTCINLFNKKASIYVLLFLLSFLGVFPNIFLSFDQISSQWYLLSRFLPIFPNISIKTNYQHFDKNNIFIIAMYFDFVLYLLICLKIYLFFILSLIWSRHLFYILKGKIIRNKIQSVKTL